MIEQEMMDKLVNENLNEFKRGQKPSHALHIGHIKKMPEIAVELKERIELEIQADVEVCNHPVNKSCTSDIFDNPVYVINGGLEEGYGITNEGLIAAYWIHIDPFDLKIYGEISVDAITSNQNDGYYEIGPRNIKSNEVYEMSKQALIIYDELIEKANLDIDW